MICNAINAQIAYVSRIHNKDSLIFLHLIKINIDSNINIGHGNVKIVRNILYSGYGTDTTVTHTNINKNRSKMATFLNNGLLK